MVISSLQITSKPVTSNQRRYGGTNKIQRFQRKGKTQNTQGTGRRFRGSNLSGSSGTVSTTSPVNGRTSSFGSTTRSTSQSISNSVTNTAKATSVAKSGGILKGLSALGTLGVGLNAKGDIDFGISSAGIGASVSTRGDVSLGVGIVSVTWNFQNPNESALGFGFNTLTITGEQQGCQIVLSYRILGQIVNQETRQADECKGEEDKGKEGTDTNNQGNEPDPNSGEDVSRTSNTQVLDIPPGGYFILQDFQVDVKKYSAGVLTSVTTNFETINSNLITGFRNPIFIPEGWQVLRESGTVTHNKYVTYENSYGKWFVDSLFANNFLKGTFKRHFNNFYLFNPVHKQKIGIEFSNYVTGVTLAPSPAISEGQLFSITASTRVYFQPINKIEPYQPKSRGLIMEDEKEICYRVYEMLGGDTFYYKGLMVDNSMFIPGGQGMFRMKTYNEIMNIIFRTFSHRTVGEIEFTITDTNKGAKGNQAVQIKTVNAQGYFTNLMKTLVESKNENTDQLNVLVRLGLITSQLMKVLVIASENIKSIIGYLGVPQKDVLEKVDIPFDLSLNGQLTKGFSTREDLQKELLKIVDKDTEEAIEGILDRFLDEWQMPVKVRKLRGSKEGGDFWFWLRQNLPK